MKIINMIEAIEEKQSKKKIIITNRLPSLSSLKELTIIGKFSYYQNASQKRIIDKTESIELRPGLIETPPNIARTYLYDKYKLSPRLSKVQFDANVESLRQMPNYAKPSSFEYGFYIDIKSAYWSIMNIAGWDVDYYPGKWLSDGTPPGDFPFPEHKTARSCLYSAGSVSFENGRWSSSIPYYDPNYRSKGKLDPFDSFKNGNPLANPGLCKLTSDVLNAIATQAIGAGAVYANTDGFIAPNERVAGHIVHIIMNWGLEARVKAEGKGGVKSAGAYKVGNEVSSPYKIRKDTQAIKKVFEPRYITWLEKTFSFWARENT
jgi:hypothetical protein